jgi:hypothetical protein
MTSSLGLRAIAEVVESEAAARSLGELGCNFAQGYYFSEPLEAADAFELVRRSPGVSTVVAPGPAAAAAPRSDGAGDETMIIEDTPTLALPNTPTLVLQAAIDEESALAEEEGAGSRRSGA